MGVASVEVAEGRFAPGPLRLGAQVRDGAAAARAAGMDRACRGRLDVKRHFATKNVTRWLGGVRLKSMG